MSRHDAWLHQSTFVEQLAVLPPGSPISRAFRARPELSDAFDKGYRALIGLCGAMRVEQLAVVTFSALLHGDETVARHFHDLLAAEDAALAAILVKEARDAARPGPYGTWPPGPLSAEDLDGPVWRAGQPLLIRLGTRLVRALEHTYLMTLHPRDASDVAQDALARAGWQPEEIQELNGLIAWIGAVSPVVAGLRGYALTHRSVGQEVTNTVVERDQLAPTPLAAQAWPGPEDLHPVADRGCYRAQ